MFWNNRDYKAEAEDLRKELNALAAQNEKLDAKLKEAMDDLQSVDEEYAGFKAKVQTQQSELETLKQKHANEIEMIKKSLNHKINTALSSMGVETFATEEFVSNTNGNDQAALAKFNSLNGAEKTDFYNTNKDKITRALLGNNLTKS